MSAGQRTRLVTIEATPADITTSASRFPKEVWSPLVDVWMEKLEVSNAEQLAADQLAGTLSHRWRFAYRCDMDPDLVDVLKLRRLNFAGRIYDITSAIEMGNHESIELTTKAGSRVDEA